MLAPTRNAGAALDAAAQPSAARRKDRYNRAPSSLQILHESF